MSVMGKVVEFIGNPGKRRLALRILVGGESEPQTHFLLAGEMESKVTWAGHKIGLSGVLVCLVGAVDDVLVTLHPLDERYGASVQAEFVAREEK